MVLYCIQQNYRCHMILEDVEEKDETSKLRVTFLHSLSFTHLSNLQGISKRKAANRNVHVDMNTLLFVPRIRFFHFNWLPIRTSQEYKKNATKVDCYIVCVYAFKTSQNSVLLLRQLSLREKRVGSIEVCSCKSLRKT